MLPFLSSTTVATDSLHEAPNPAIRMDVVLSGLLLVLSALPFFALPLGSDTNLPLSSVICVVLIARYRRHRTVLAVAAIVAVAPFFATFIRMFFAPEPWQPVETLAWMIYTLPIAGTTTAILTLQHRAITWLSWTLLFSALFVIVQKHVFIDALQTVPFAPLYELPGYWTFTEDPETFLTYVKRPFGMFPESSFMAGTLSLMTMALVVLLHRYGRHAGARDLVALGLVVWAVAVSGSGSAVLVLGPVVIAALVTTARRHPRTAVLLLPPALLAAGIVSAITLAQRQRGFNYSWADRYSSLAASAKLMLDDPVIFWTGLGRGGANQTFLDGGMPLGMYQHYNPLPDIYSVAGRVLLEQGMLVGLAFVASICVIILRAGGGFHIWLGLCSLLVWVVASGMTISYDSAYWIWGLPGLFLGLELSSSRSTAPQLAPSSNNL